MIMRTPGKYQGPLEPRAKLKVVVNMHGPIRSNRVLRPVQVRRVRGTKGKQVGNVEPGGIFPPGKSCTAPYCLVIYFCIRCGWIKHHKCHRTIARIPGPYARQGISVEAILADMSEFVHIPRNIIPPVSSQNRDTRPSSQKGRNCVNPLLFQASRPAPAWRCGRFLATTHHAAILNNSSHNLQVSHFTVERHS